MYQSRWAVSLALSLCLAHAGLKKLRCGQFSLPGYLSVRSPSWIGPLFSCTNTWGRQGESFAICHRMGRLWQPTTMDQTGVKSESLRIGSGASWHCYRQERLPLIFPNFLTSRDSMLSTFCQQETHVGYFSQDFDHNFLWQWFSVSFFFFPSQYKNISCWRWRSLIPYKYEDNT